MSRPGGGPVTLAKVQIIDLAAGAKLRLATGGVIGRVNPADNEFSRNTLPWFAESNGVGEPPSRQWPFSVTNASFFTSTSTPYTKLSMPYKYGGVKSHGVAIYGQDPAARLQKRVLRLSSPSSQYPTMRAQIQTFATTYTAESAECGEWFACIVGFHPTTDPSGDPTTIESRTFVGVNSALGVDATRAYILTAAGLTVDEADAVLKHFGANATLQLDGGGSTRMESYAGGFNPNAFLNRAVPNVLVAMWGP